jgi:hypothetical protein
MTELTIDRPRARVLRPLLEGAVVVVFMLLVWSNFTLRRQARAAAIPTVSQHGFVPRDALRTIPIVDVNGKPGTLDLQRGRTIVAIVDPRCESCRALVDSMRGSASGIRILSMAPLAETREMAQKTGLTPAIAMLGQPIPRRLESQLQIYPQLFIVDSGKVVRSCATLEECR